MSIHEVNSRVSKQLRESVSGFIGKHDSPARRWDDPGIRKPLVILDQPQPTKPKPYTPPAPKPTAPVKSAPIRPPAKLASKPVSSRPPTKIETQIAALERGLAGTMGLPETRARWAVQLANLRREVGR